MLAYYVHDLSPFLLRFSETWGIRWYGFAYVLAFGVGILLVQRLSRKGFCDIPENKVSDFIMGAAIFGVLLGGRLGYMLFYDLDRFLENPLIFVRVWDGGMSAHGGIIGLTLYTWWYSWRHKVSWLNISDSLAVVGPMGVFFGRLANFINGELYGRPTNVSWAVQFPTELRVAPMPTMQVALEKAEAINPSWNTIEAVIENSRHSEALRTSLSEILIPRHPSQIYEALMEGLLIFSILWILRTRFRLPNGVIAGIFFILYAILRCVGELFREPDAPLTGIFTRGQFLSFFLVLVGIIFISIALSKRQFPIHQRSA